MAMAAVRKQTNNKSTHFIPMFRKYLLPCLVCILVLTGCGGRRVTFSETCRVDGTWNKDSLYRFDVEFAPGCYDIDLIVRNTGDYAYQNLWLFVVTATADTLVADTVECYLADQYGRWIGSGSIGSIYTCNVSWRDSLVLSDTLRGTYSIAHGMRIDDLDGIRNIGIRVTEHKD